MQCPGNTPKSARRRPVLLLPQSPLRGLHRRCWPLFSCAITTNKRVGSQCPTVQDMDASTHSLIPGQPTVSLMHKLRPLFPRPQRHCGLLRRRRRRQEQTVLAPFSSSLTWTAVPASADTNHHPHNAVRAISTSKFSSTQLAMRDHPVLTSTPGPSAREDSPCPQRHQAD